MYRYAVCDDNAADAAFVVSLIEKWSKDHWNKRNGNDEELSKGKPDVEDQDKKCQNQESGDKRAEYQVEIFSSAEAFLFAFEENQDFDLLFLDIEMGGMSGVELAKKLRQMGAGLQIVFITGYMDYISEGYDVEALHYLMKPVTVEKLGAVLDRAMERIKTRERELVLTLPGSIVRVPLCEIRYIEVLKNYVTVHAAEDYSLKKTLNELKKGLDDSFLQIHRSYIVGLRCIKRVTKTEVILKDNTILPLSRKLYNDLNQALIHYF